MAWRLTRRRWEEGRGERNRRALKRLVEQGRRGRAGAQRRTRGRVVQRRAACGLSALETKRSLATDWDERTWSVTYFFVAKDWRARGLGERMLRAARGPGEEAPGDAHRGLIRLRCRGTGAICRRRSRGQGLPQVFERAGFTALAEAAREAAGLREAAALSRERRAPARLCFCWARREEEEKRRGGRAEPSWSPAFPAERSCSRAIGVVPLGACSRQDSARSSKVARRGVEARQARPIVRAGAAARAAA